MVVGLSFFFSSFELPRLEIFEGDRKASKQLQGSHILGFC